MAASPHAIAPLLHSLPLLHCGGLSLKNKILVVF
jgi:hypothetical protein